MVTVQWWVFPALVFTGIGIRGVLGAIVLAHRDLRALDRQEQQEPHEQAPMVIATGIDAYLGGMVQPEPPQIDREWVPWDMGWAGEETTQLPAIEAAVEVDALDDGHVLNIRDRFTYPTLDRHLADQLTSKRTLVATWPKAERPYPPIRIEVSA